MKTGKQVLCFLLALALLIGLLPATVQPVQARGAAMVTETTAAAQDAELAEPMATHVLNFSFVGGTGTIVVNGEDKGTSVEVESGSDLKFRVKAPGYQINVVLLGSSRQPLTADANGEYTITNVTKSQGVTIMVTPKENVALSFEVVDAKVTIADTDYTGETYSAQYNEEVTFAVEPDATGAAVTVEADHCSITDHGDGTYTTSGLTSATKITVTAEGGEERPRFTVELQFSISEANGSMWVNGVNCGTSVQVVSGRDLKFEVKVALGYKINVLLLGGRQPIQPDSDGFYTLKNVTENCKITVMLTQMPDQQVTFDVIGTKVTMDGVDYSNKSYSAQYGESITFHVASEIGNVSLMVTADHCSITDNGDGTYTTSGITAATTITAQAEGAVKEPHRIAFQCTNAKVTVNQEDYTNGVYPYLGGQLIFNVEIPDGYYIKAVTASDDAQIINLSELRDGKTSYHLPEVRGSMTITVLAEPGQENTWPLEYRYMYRGLGGADAQIIACAPAYSGTLDVDYVIHNGTKFTITSIGEGAFAQCYKLTELTMSDAVRSIGDAAFAYTGLRQIRLSENLWQIPSECFLYSIYLEELVIPEGVEVIRDYAFKACGMQSITLPDSLTTIEAYAFVDCLSLQEVTVPAGVTKIEEGVFYECTSLKNIKFLGNIVSIEESAFGFCGVENINLPETLTELGRNAFYGSNLRKIVIPRGVTEIKPSTFADCENLETVIFTGEIDKIDSYAFERAALQSVDLPDSMVSIGSEAFAGTKLKEVRIPRDCTEIGDKAFYESPIEKFVVAPDSQTFMAGKDGVLFSKDGTRLLLYPYGCADKTYTVPAGVERIERYAFYANPNLEEVTFPESLRDFGDSAFERLPRLKRLTLPEGLEDITGNQVFQVCRALTELNMPSTLKNISGNGNFCEIGIEELELPENMNNISGYETFRNCENLKKVILPKNLEIISGQSLFLGCTELTDVVFPENLKAITGILNFARTGMESVKLPASLQELGRATFESCERLKEVQLPEGLQVLGGNNFRGCILLQSIVIPEGIEVLGDGTFMDCTSLEEIKIPNRVKEIGNDCFNGCEKLTEVTLPENLEILGNFVFVATGITELNLPASLKSFGIAPIAGKYESGRLTFDVNEEYVLRFAGDMPEWTDPSQIMPNLAGLYCYYPRENRTWTDNLRYVMDGSLYKVHWLAADVCLPENLELLAGFERQLTNVVRPMEDPNLPLTWTSSNETVVRVDEDGTLTGVTPGTAVITATAGGTYSAQCQVTVVEGGKTEYQDVPENAWYYEAVRYTSAYGLFQGVTETKFGPNLTMNRGMLVTVLYRMEGEPSVEGQTHSFTDVSANRYYTDAVAWAANQGLIQGMTETQFAPETAVTREQMVTILYRYAGMKGADLTGQGELSSFPDGDQVKNYAKEAFSWAVGAGIIQGTVNGGVTTLSPRSGSTRAQVAAVLMRYLQNMG